MPRSAGQVGLGDDAERLSGDGECRVHRSRGGEEAAVDDPEVVHIMRPAPGTEHALGGISPGHHGPALVAVHADVEVLRQDNVIAHRTEQTLGAPVEKAVGAGAPGDPRGRDLSAAVDRDAVVRGGQVLRHHQPLDAARATWFSSPSGTRGVVAFIITPCTLPISCIAPRGNPWPPSWYQSLTDSVFWKVTSFSRLKSTATMCALLCIMKLRPTWSEEFARPRGCLSPAEASSSAAELTAPAASTNLPPVT